MRDGAHLTGSIPNVRYFDNLHKLIVRRDCQYRDVAILDRAHLRFFTQRSLEMTLLGAGFAIQRIRGINPAQGLVQRIAIGALVCATLGGHRNIRFLQFGFRASSLQRE